MQLRPIHSCTAIFVAPSILFFALSGAMQLFDLHEAHGKYGPPALIEKLGELHKNQMFAVRKRDVPAAVASAGPMRPGARQESVGQKGPDLGPRQTASTLVLKCFFLFATIGLLVSTGLGLWLGLYYGRRNRFVWLLLVSGAAIPVLAACF